MRPPLPGEPPASGRQPKAPFTNQIWAGTRPGPREESRDHPLCGGQRPGPQVTAGTTPVRGSHQDPKVSRDHLYEGHKVREGPSLPSLPPRAHLPTPQQGKQGSWGSQPCVLGGMGLGPGMGWVPTASLATLCNSWSAHQDRSHAWGLQAQVASRSGPTGWAPAQPCCW